MKSYSYYGWCRNLSIDCRGAIGTGLFHARPTGGATLQVFVQPGTLPQSQMVQHFWCVIGHRLAVHGLPDGRCA